jgi:hypothetical protein
MKCIECGNELTTEAEINHGICYDCAIFDIDEDDDDYDDDDWQERKEQELYERACECTCGAWQHKDGVTYHVADCCCGAE